jgi:hypothetical protein
MAAKRVENDFYPTEARLTNLILRECRDIPDLILEPCAGRRDISKILQASGREVMSTDLVDPDGEHLDATKRDYWIKRSAALAAASNPDCRNWATVTNPPFSLAPQILSHALDFSPWGVAMLLRLSFLEPTKNRAEILQKHADNLMLVMPVSPRPRFRADSSGCDSVTVAWFVWQRSWSWRLHGVKPPFKFADKWRQDA